MAATEEVLGAIHTAVATELLSQIVDGTTVLDKEGVAHKVSASPALLNVARQLLKDNNIECDKSNVAASKLAGAVSTLPSFDDEDPLTAKVSH